MDNFIILHCILWLLIYVFLPCHTQNCKAIPSNIIFSSFTSQQREIYRGYDTDTFWCSKGTVENPKKDLNPFITVEFSSSVTLVGIGIRAPPAAHRKFGFLSFRVFKWLNGFMYEGVREGNIKNKKIKNFPGLTESDIIKSRKINHMFPYPVVSSKFRLFFKLGLGQDHICLRIQFYRACGGQKQDMCNSNGVRCEHICHDIPGSFYCSCKKGYRLWRNGLNCVPDYGINYKTTYTTVIYEEAQAYCYHSGGFLTTVFSKEEYNRMKRNITKWTQYPFYIGVVDVDEDKSYSHWIDGSDVVFENFEYRNLNPGSAGLYIKNKWSSENKHGGQMYSCRLSDEDSYLLSGFHDIQDFQITSSPFSVSMSLASTLAFGPARSRLGSKSYATVINVNDPVSKFGLYWKPFSEEKKYLKLTLKTENVITGVIVLGFSCRSYSLRFYIEYKTIDETSSHRTVTYHVNAQSHELVFIKPSFKATEIKLKITDNTICKGYQWDLTGHLTGRGAVDECLTSPCDHFCIDTPESFYCRCKKNYHLFIDGKTCLPDVFPVENPTLLVPDYYVFKDSFQSQVQVGAYYGFFPNEKSFDEATEHCAKHGGFLPSVHKISEHRLMYPHLLKHSNCTKWFLGLNGSSVIHTSWQDGSWVDFTLFSVSLPEFGHQNIAAFMDKKLFYLWNVAPFNSVKACVVCQYQHKDCNQPVLKSKARHIKWTYKPLSLKKSFDNFVIGLENFLTFYPIYEKEGYIQADFQIDFVLHFFKCVSNRGDSEPTSVRNIFNIEYSLDQFEVFSFIADQYNQQMEFSCGPQAYVVKSIPLLPPVIARFIRMSWKYERKPSFTISIELFGCPARTSDVGQINTECGNRPSQYSLLPSLRSFTCFYKRCIGTRMNCGNIRYYYDLGFDSCSSLGPCDNLPCKDGSICLERRHNFKCHCPVTIDGDCKYVSEMHVMVENSLIKVDDYVTVYFVLKDTKKNLKFYINVTEEYSCTPELHMLSEPNGFQYYCGIIKYQITDAGTFNVTAKRTVKGFLQSSNTATFRVSFLNQVTKVCLGSLRITGAAKSMQLAFVYEIGKKLYFRSSGTGACQNKPNFIITSYRWTLKSYKFKDALRCYTNKDFDAVRLPFQIGNKNTLTVPSDMLKEGLYRLCLNITVFYFETYHKESCGFFKIYIPPLKVIIEPSEIHQVIPNNFPVILDASQSMDPKTGDSYGLKYQWYCNKKSGKPGCENVKQSFLSDSDFDYMTPDMLPVTEPVLNIQKGYMTVNETYFITVEISKDGLESRKTVTVHSLPSNAPKLRIRCLHNCREEVTSSEILSLSVVCENCVSVNTSLVKYKWLLSSKKLGNIPYSVWKSKSSTGNDKEAIVLKEKTLNFSDTYVFTVSADTDNGLKGHVMITLKTAKPPGGGKCSISPKTGKALVTEFVVSCAGYFTFNMPLSYTVYQNDYETGTLLYHGFEDTVTLKLPEGPEEMDFWITLTVTATDAVGTRTSFPLTVQVLNPQDSKETSVEFFDKILNDASSDFRLMKTPVQNFLQQAKNVVGMLGKDKHALSSEKLKESQMRNDLLNDISKIDIDNEYTLLQMADIMADITVQEEDMSNKMEVRSLSVSRKIIKSLLRISKASPAIARAVAKKQTESLYAIIPFAKEEKKPPIGVMPPTVSPEYAQKMKNKSKMILNLFSEVGEAMLGSLKTVVEDPIKIKTKQAVLLVLRRKPNVREIQIIADEKKADEVGGTFIFPKANTLASDYKVTKPVDTQVLFLGKNPFIWSQSANSINLPVMKVSLETEMRRLSLYNLSTPVAFFISVNFSKILPEDEIHSLNVTTDQDDHTITYSNAIQIKIPAIHGKTQVLKIFSLDSSLTLQVYVGSRQFDVSIDNIEKKGFEWPIREIALLKYENHKQDPYLLFLPEEFLGENKTSFFVGIRVKPGQYLNLGQSKTAFVYVGIQTFTIECFFWNERREAWSKEGCLPGPFTTLTSLHCWCNHLTSFSGGIFIAPNTVDPVADTAMFFTFFDNPVVVTVVVAVWTIYFLLLSWAHRADAKDTRKSGISVLSDNSSSDKYTYLICVVTGWWRHAGTTSRVFMYLKGTKGRSARHALYDPEKHLFTSGAENWFLFKTSFCLGDIKSIVIWHDHTGDKPSWFLKEVVVKDVHTDENWHCVFDDWISIDKGFGTLTAEIPAIEDHEFVSRRFYLFMQASSRNFRDGHLWISIFFKPAKSTFTRIQRLTCALCVLITTMLTNIMYHGIPTTDPEDQIDYGDFHLSLVDFVIGIQSALLVFPINIIIIVLFTLVKRRPDIVIKHEDEDEDEEDEKQPKKKEEMIAKEEKNGWKNYRLPWYYIYFAYFVAFGTSIVCSYFVMLYGLKYGYHKSVSWLFSFFTSFLENAFILQPLKVFSVAILLTLLLKQTVKYDTGIKKEIETEGNIFEHKDLHKRESIFLHKLHVPAISDKLLENVRMKVLMDQKTWDILMEIILYFSFVIIVLLVVLGHSDVTVSYRVTRSVEDIFIRSHVEPNRQYFYNVTDANTMWQYLNDTFLENILFGPCNPVANTVAYLVGRARLRQVRLRRGGPCVTLTGIDPKFEFSVLDLDQRVNNSRKCYGIFRYDFDDRGMYDTNWQPKNFTNTSSIWRFQSKFKLGPLPMRAKMGIYPGGGYVVELPRNPFEGQKVIEEVRKTKWIDRQTRIVFVEFTLFNPNVQLFTVVVLMFEYSNTGFVFPYHHIYTANFYHYQNEFETFVAVCEVLFVIYLLSFTYMEIKRFLNMDVKEYFKDTWSYVEIVILALSYVTIGLFINRFFLCNNLMGEFKNNDFETFVGFYTAAFFDALLTYVFASLILLTIIKFFKLLRFNARLSMLSETLRAGRGKLTAYSFGLFGFTMAFSIFALLCFGCVLEGYKNYQSTVVTLFLFMLGESDYYGLYEANSILGPVFFFLFALTFQFILLQYFITLLMESFHATRMKIASVETEVHMVQYIMKRFRLLTMTNQQPKRQKIYHAF